MITDYKRPKSLEEAQKYVQEGWQVLGGGGFISKHQDQFQKVVDLQDAGLSYCKKENNQIRLGAMTTLQDIVDYSYIPAEFVEIIKREKSFNLRNAATIAGTILCADGRSDILAWLLCADAQLIVNGSPVQIMKYLQSNHNDLIEAVQFKVQQVIHYEKISRTPDDFTIVGVFLSRDLLTRKMNAVLNGLTDAAPLIIEQVEPENLKEAIDNKLKISHSQLSTKWSSLKYQNKMIKDLVSRLLLRFNE